MTAPSIRPFAPTDTDACYSVCLRTAADGGDATDRHTDPRIVGEVWVGPYLVRHPDFAFVVEDDEGVGGYVVGTPDTVAFDRWLDAAWFPPLRERYPRGCFPPGTADADCVDLIHTPPRMPAEIATAYPAHLHIDLLPRLQRRGRGKRLLNALFSVCRGAGVGRIHLGCSPANTKAIAFYRHVGFEDLVGGYVWGRSTEAIG